MKLLFINSIVMILSFASAQAETKSINCRDAIVEASKLLNSPLSADQFSVMSPSEFTYSPQAYNALSPKEQEEIFIKFTPLKRMVSKVRTKLLEKIDISLEQAKGTEARQAVERLNGQFEVLGECDLE